MSGHWRDVLAVRELPAEGLVPVAVDGRKLAVGRADGRLVAIDDRCPHEGYPLHQGVLAGCVLTCAWHNWKFDLRDGSNALGGEGLSTCPVRERDGRVEVDVTPPPPERVIADALASLEAAQRDHDVPRACRDAARALHAGLPPEALLAWTAAWDGRHGEYGCTHALPVAADLLAFVGGQARPWPATDPESKNPAAPAPPLLGIDDPAAVLGAVAVALDLAGRSSRRLPARVRGEPLQRGDERDFVRFIEREQIQLAESVLRGRAARGGDPWGWLLAACSEHFTDFGHQLIYTTKAWALPLSPPQLGDVAGGLAVSLGHATREDTLPYLRRWYERWSAVEPRLAELDAGLDPEDRRADLALVDAALDAPPQDAHDALVRGLEEGRAAAAIADDLVAAAALRVLRFDVAHDADPDIAEAWLWATHRLTFAVAARTAVERWPDPRRLRFLLQSLAFTRSGRKMDGAAAPEPREAAGCAAAVVAFDPAAAVAAARRELDEAPNVLRSDLLRLSLQDRFVEPIHVAHALKTTVAAWESWDRMVGHPHRAAPVLAAVRHLASRRAERTVQTQARRAWAFVAHDVRLRKLTQ